MGRCYGNQLIFENFGKRQNLPHLFVALAFRNGMGYRHLNVRIDSINDASMSSKNFVNFGPVTPELTDHM